MILCAALKVRFFESSKEEFITKIITCFRHGDGLRLINDLNQLCTQVTYKISVEEQGFITTDGKFLDRKDAYKHAIECGQLNQTTLWHKQDRNEDELYSEDLY